MTEMPDPCLPLALALLHLRAAYGEPKTRAQIAAWNETEAALDDIRARLNGVKDDDHKLCGSS